jgi:hypothetical protein
MRYGVSVSIGKKRKTLRKGYKTKKEAGGYAKFLVKHKDITVYKNPRTIRKKKK